MHANNLRLQINSDETCHRKVIWRDLTCSVIELSTCHFADRRTLQHLCTFPLTGKRENATTSNERGIGSMAVFWPDYLCMQPKYQLHQRKKKSLGLQEVRIRGPGSRSRHFVRFLPCVLFSVVFSQWLLFVGQVAYSECCHPSKLHY